MSRSVLVYAPINIDVVDGSAIWLRSICETLSLVPDTQVDLLLFSTPLGEIAPIRGVRKMWFPSSKVFAQSGISQLSGLKFFTDASARLAVTILHKVFAYDYLLVRGTRAAWELSSLGDDGPALLAYLTDVDRSLVWTNRRQYEVQMVRDIADRSAAMLFQTVELANLIGEISPSASSKAMLLRPMIPDDTVHPLRERASSTLKMVYAGKFAPDWAVDELFEVQDALTEDDVPIELDVFGNKVHRVPGGFTSRINNKLKNSNNFTWHGAVQRDELLKVLPNYDLGYAYRRSALLASPEISTKLLEYVATGVAPILNRTPIHAEYFGPEYPFYANNKNELSKTIRLASTDGFSPAEVLGYARSKVEKHLFGNVAGELAKTFRQLEGYPLKRAAQATKQSVLVVGHDLKFMTHLSSRLFSKRNFTVATVNWPRFQEGGEAETQSAMSSADIVFCEWALGNAVFCSKNKRPGQKLIVRFHRFEQTTDLPQQIDIENVDLMVTVSHHLADQLRQIYDWPEHKIKVIPNTIDCDSLNRPKTASAKFNLGMVGYLPKLKRLDLAIDLLSKLRLVDRRYMLHIKGKMPWELPWIWNERDQYQFYSGIFERLRLDKDLAGSVVFDDHGPDIARWFQKIGWVLSLSDVESFHLGGVEGMASGAFPAVIERSGADQIFPKQFVQSSTSDLAEMILRCRENDRESDDAAHAMVRAHACGYDVDLIVDRWISLLQEAGILMAGPDSNP